MRPGHEPVPHCRTLRLLGPRLPRTPPIRRSSPVSRSARCARLGTKPGAPDLVPVRIADLPHGGVAPRRLLGRDRWRPPGAGCRSGSGLRSDGPSAPIHRKSGPITSHSTRSGRRMRIRSALAPISAHSSRGVGRVSSYRASLRSASLGPFRRASVPGGPRQPRTPRPPPTRPLWTPAITDTAGGLGTPRETRRSPTRPPEPDG